MRRLIVGFLLLALVVVGGLAWAVTSALKQHSERRLLDHKLVAERVFDELERHLSVLVHREESRPVTHYRYFYVPEDLLVGSVAVGRSPLADQVDDDFILGYVQWEPTGQVSSPALPQQNDLTRTLALEAEPVADQLVADMSSWSDNNGAVLMSCMTNPNGLTNFLQPGRPKAWTTKGTLPAMPPPQPEPQGPPTQAEAAEILVDVHRQFDEAVQVRDDKANVALQVKGIYSDRQYQKRTQRLSASSLYEYQNPYNNLNQALVLQNAQFTQPWQLERDLFIELPGNDSPVVKEPSYGDFNRDLVEQIGTNLDQGVDVTVDRFKGRAIDGDRFLMVREVEWSRQLYLQGLVLDLERMAGYLAGAVLDDNLRQVVDLDFIWTEQRAASSDDGYCFAHRFAQPFADVGVTCTIAPLPGADPTAWLVGMAAVVGLIVFGGFMLIGRAVGARLEYAKRRQDFVAAVSHELRTPLTSIRMYGEMLRDGMVADDETRHRYHATITSEGERLSRLIDNVLELARLERGEGGGEIRVGAVGDIIEAVARIVAPHAANHGFKVSVSLDAELPSVQVDRDGLVQAILNLIDNSIKFCKSCERKEINLLVGIVDGQVRIVVRDHGPGVPRSQLAKIVEPFHRGEDELTRTTKGTGIGLALVRHLVQRMGGQLQLGNHPEGGFRVAITLAAAPS